MVLSVPTGIFGLVVNLVPEEARLQTLMDCWAIVTLAIATSRILAGSMRVGDNAASLALC